MRSALNNEDDRSSSSFSSDEESSSSSSSSSSSRSSSSSTTSSSRSSIASPFRPRLPFLRQRRRGGDLSEDNKRSSNNNNNNGSKSGEADGHHHPALRHPRGSTTSSSTTSTSCSFSSISSCAKRNNPFSSYCLAVALLIWCMVHLPLFEEDDAEPPWYSSQEDADFVQAVQGRRRQQPPPPRRIIHPLSTPSNPSSFSHNNNNNNNNKNTHNFWGNTTTTNNDANTKQGKKEKSGMEDLPEGCEFPYEWQTTSFPNCNQLHEIDLRQHIKLTKKQNKGGNRHQEKQPEDPPNHHQQQQQPREYYLSSGMWRDVFSMVLPEADTETEYADSVVMKLMKIEHPVDTRNWDRHRRDALTMERLTSSPNIVDIYGYCGNTVLIEQAPIDLDSYLKEHQQQSQQQQQQVVEEEEISASTTATNSLTLYRKLQMALDAARAMAAVHSLDIIHADLQTKQFLVDAKGTVKVNDFNRCRFLPRRLNETSSSSTTATTRSTSTGDVCPVRIPSAPGLWRSPEEYSAQPVVTAMDVYSLGNVLHQILVGERPFKGERASELKRKVRHGVHPEINVVAASSIIRRNGIGGGTNDTDKTVDNDDDYSTAKRLAVLIQLCLERDVDKRITAVDLARELELLLAAEEEREQHKRRAASTASKP